MFIVYVVKKYTVLEWFSFSKNTYMHFVTLGGFKHVWPNVNLENVFLFFKIVSKP